MMSNENKAVTASDAYGIELGFNLQRILVEEMVTYRNGVITIRRVGALEHDFSKWFASKVSQLPRASYPSCDVAVLIYENSKIKHAQMFSPLESGQQ
ncbi:MAG: hypothetical protein EOO43_13850 [Flavobacterium sp.]|nr:MAG: hypothetical protein EOO43_13850 [Flavobacterium sp.]